ncbi:MAG: SDR family oxidoreductase [Spirochaetales bacterium]|nr:SDR family oxidoreductase [Spirochaetales bacterium]
MTYIEELFDFSGEVAVITGGGGSLPGAMACALAKAGAKVCLWGRGKSTPLDQVARKMGEETGKAEKITGVTVDTGKEDDVIAALAQTEKEIGVPTILINGVGGVGYKSDFIDADIHQYEEILRNNLLAGCVIPIKVFAGYWIRKKIRGSIINIASMASYIPLPGTWAYDAAKAGVVNMTMAAAVEFAPHNIRVNAIAPGFFLARQNKHLLVDEKTGEFTERGKIVVRATPFKRFGEPDELAGVTLLLANNRASGFITGICIPVDGGFHAHSI